MKTIEMKPGQLFGVHFPYALTAVERNKKFGFKLDHFQEVFPNGEATVYMRDVKTNEVILFGFDREVPENWVLLEEAPCK